MGRDNWEPTRYVATLPDGTRLLGVYDGDAQAVEWLSLRLGDAPRGSVCRYDPGSCRWEYRFEVFPDGATARRPYAVVDGRGGVTFRDDGAWEEPWRRLGRGTRYGGRSIPPT